MACKPLLAEPASVVGLTFDATVSWPVYDWMGVSKAALESTSRYLARYLGPQGIRVNLVAAGPLETLAKKRSVAPMPSTRFGASELRWAGT